MIKKKPQLSWMQLRVNDGTTQRNDPMQSDEPVLAAAAQRRAFKPAIKVSSLLC